MYAQKLTVQDARQGLIVATLIYGTFTVSTWSAPTGFDHAALWALQFIMLSAGLVSLALVMRNASVRKADISTRFELEKAHHQMMHLSHKDPLTAATGIQWPYTRDERRDGLYSTRH